MSVKSTGTLDCKSFAICERCARNNQQTSSESIDSEVIISSKIFSKPKRTTKSRHFEELPSISETSFEIDRAMKEETRHDISKSTDSNITKSSPRPVKRRSQSRRGSQLSVNDKQSVSENKNKVISAVTTREPKTKLKLKTKGSHGSRTEEGLSRKYLKMKYEIELQNFAIDKLNRELQAMTLKCCPEPETRPLKHRLGLEVSKLCRMIELSIKTQRQNPKDKWGPIPISTIGEPMKISSPQRPSGISNISGFEDLEVSLADETNGKCLKIETAKLRELRKLKQETSTISVEHNSSSNQLNHKPSRKSLDCTKILSEAIGETMNELLINMKTMKGDIKSLHNNLHSIRQNK